MLYRYVRSPEPGVFQAQPREDMAKAGEKGGLGGGEEGLSHGASRGSPWGGGALVPVPSVSRRTERPVSGSAGAWACEAHTWVSGSVQPIRVLLGTPASLRAVVEWTPPTMHKAKGYSSFD